MLTVSADPRPPLGRRVYADRPGFWLGVIFAVIGLGFATFGGWYLYEAVALDRSGETASGTVTGHHISTSHGSRGGTTRFYRLEVTFRDSNGATHADDFTVSRGFFNVYAGASAIRVRYVPDRPWIAEIESGRDRQQGMIAGGFGAALLFGALISLGIALRQAASRKRALIDGVARQAEVTAVRPYGKRNAKSGRLHWRDASGATGITAHGKLASFPAVGASVTVFIDPRTGRGYWAGEY